MPGVTRRDYMTNFLVLGFPCGRESDSTSLQRAWRLLRGPFMPGSRGTSEHDRECHSRHQDERERHEPAWPTGAELTEDGVLQPNRCRATRRRHGAFLAGVGYVDMDTRKRRVLLSFRAVPLELGPDGRLGDL